ncbi:hypothetical protein ACFT5B_06995 [Luteimicrobium sp. NPDC057192]|uniref:hypothetical protein n=1 Tax=Luteimicrobium sp. NPDC057192 TaxID=3346042 RepID=UPI00363039D0
MTSPAAVLRLAKRAQPPRPRLGFVTAVDTGAQLVTVAFEDGSTTSSLSWASSAYPAPAVGDRVSVVPHSTGWVVMSKVTPRPQLIADQQVVVPMAHNWQGFYHESNPAAGWNWYDYANITDKHEAAAAWQGRVPPQQGGAGYVQTTWDVRASILTWGALASLVPSGATISQVRLTLRASWVQQDAARPVLYGHAYTPASPPRDVVYDTNNNVVTPGAPPSFVAGFGPLRFPSMVAGDAQTITIPSSWVTALLAGTITGLGLYSATNADGVLFANASHLANVVEIDGGYSGDTVWDSDDNLQITITYSGGTT